MEGLKDSMAEYAQEGGPRARQLSYRYPKPLPAILGLISAAAGFALAAHHQLAPVLAIGLVFSSWVAFFARPQLWLRLLPAPLPAIGLAVRAN